MVVKLSGSKASSSLKSGKSVNAGSFSVKARSTSVSTGKAVSSFKVLSAPSSSFSEGKSTGGSFKSGTYNPSKTKIPTPTKTIEFKKITPVAGIKPVKTEDIVSKVKEYASIHIIKPTPTKTPSKPGIWSLQSYGNPVPYVAPKPTPVTVKKVKYTTGTSVAPAPKTTVKKSSSGSSGGGPKIGTHHPDSVNKAMTAPGGGKLRSKNIGTGGKVTY